MSISCPYCTPIPTLSEGRSLIVSNGYFLRKSDKTRQQRFLCKSCKKSFSLASFSPCYRQKRRELNPLIFKSLVSGVSMRRLSLLLGTNRKTVARKLVFLGKCSEFIFLKQRSEFPPSTEVEFDDLETFEHSKMKPLSVIAMVESDTRRILGFKVARMPAKGLLSEPARKKYGYRKDERKHCREELFKEMENLIHPLATLKSDESPHYPPSVRTHFPKAKHKRYKGRRGCVVGQGELKSGGFDPLFSLNHTFAMTRANIHRLFRRTWNTTKKPECLKWQLFMYVVFHNSVLIKSKIRSV